MDEKRHREEEGRPVEGLLPAPGCGKSEGHAEGDNCDEVGYSVIGIAEESVDHLYRATDHQGQSDGAAEKGEAAHNEQGQEEVRDERLLPTRVKGVGHREVEQEQEEQKGHALKAGIEVDRLQERESGDEQQGEKGGGQLRKGAEGPATPSPEPQEGRGWREDPENGPFERPGCEKRIDQGDGGNQNPQGDVDRTATRSALWGWRRDGRTRSQEASNFFGEALPLVHAFRCSR